MIEERTLTDAQKIEWLRLLKSERVGPCTFRSLMNRFGGAAQALEALPELSRRGGAKAPVRIYPQDRAERDFEAIKALGAHLLVIGEPPYPPLLRQIYKAPPLLCVKGNLALLDTPTVGIVGTRTASVAGLTLTRKLGIALGKAEYAVVSGLARGIDTAAHQSTLRTGTLACVAGGIDVVYPPENAELYKHIGEHGLLISEYVPGTHASARHFPERNRIISGLSFAIVVVEASLRSGSLITAQCALEQGREIFAVPGSPLDARCTGTNRLIQEGATLVGSIDDLLQGLEDLLARPKPPKEYFMEDEPEGGLNQWSTHPEVPEGVRKTILELLSYVPIDINELVLEMGEPTYLVQAALLELELAGRVTRLPENRVIAVSTETEDTFFEENSP